MGFNIVIARYYYTEDNKYWLKQGKSQAYFSYNWYDMESYWYIRDDFFNRQGKDAAHRIAMCIEYMKKEGTKQLNFGDPLLQSKNWKWGINTDGEMFDESFRKSIFMYLLGQLLDLTLEYPNCFFICGDDKLPHYVIINEEGQDVIYKAEWN